LGHFKWGTRIVQAADHGDTGSGGVADNPRFACGVLEVVFSGISAARCISIHGAGKNMQLTEKHKEYWRKNLRVTGILLAVWFVVTFVIAYFARELQSITIMGFPFPFYMGAQGSLAIYVVIILFYANYMNKLDQEYGVSEGDD
jgi:putative solute:sodium symporter small subunit